MSVAEWFGVIFGGIMALGAIAGGFIFSIRAVWYLADIVAETKTGNAQTIALTKAITELASDVKAMRTELHSAHQRISAHDMQIMLLRTIAGLRPLEEDPNLPKIVMPE